MEALNFVTIPADDYALLMNTLRRAVDIIGRSEQKDEWLTTEQACQMLNVSPNTWARYRKKFHLNTSQIGRAVLVRRSEVEKLLKTRSWTR